MRQKNVAFLIDTFCFDKIIFRSIIRQSSANNDISLNDFTGENGKEQKNRPYRARIHSQTRSAGTSNRSLRNRSKNPTSNKGES